MSNKMLIVLLGEACVGKTTTENRLIKELGYVPVEIITTRPRREDDPYHYSFVSDKEFDNKEFNFVISPAYRYGYIVPNDELSVVSFISPKYAQSFADTLAFRADISIIVVRLTASAAKIRDCLDSRNMTDASDRAKAAEAGECGVDHVFDRDVAISSLTHLTRIFKDAQK